MGKLGKYCKAYPVSRLREFSGWSENAGKARNQSLQVDGREEFAPRGLDQSDFLYLQENFVVTDGIFLDENIIFDRVTPEWIDFCKNRLKFELPAYESAKPAATQEKT